MDFESDLKICPECGSVASWNSHFRAYVCENKDCACMMDKDGRVVWNNKMRDENLKRMENAGRER